MTIKILVIFAVVALLVAIATVVTAVVSMLRRHARRAGQTSVREFLRSVPRTDEERRGAIDMTLAGFAICVVGLLFPPVLLIGVFPLYFGARKMAYTALGLGLVDDPGPRNG